MVIKIEMNDGNSTDNEVKIYRGIHSGNLGQYVAGFYANKQSYKWGVMTQMRGTVHTIIHTFGKK